MYTFILTLRRHTHKHQTIVNTLADILLLGGSWDLVTTYKRAYSHTYSLPEWPYVGYPTYVGL